MWERTWARIEACDAQLEERWRTGVTKKIRGRLLKMRKALVAQSAAERQLADAATVARLDQAIEACLKAERVCAEARSALKVAEVVQAAARRHKTQLVKSVMREAGRRREGAVRTRTTGARARGIEG